MMAGQREVRRRQRAASFGARAFAALALAAAGFGSLAMAQLIRAKQFEAEPTKPVLITQIPIAAGTQLDKGTLSVSMWPESQVPDDAVASLDELFKDNAPPPTATAGMLPGDPVRWARLADPKNGTALAALVREGYRAVAVRIDDSAPRSGLIYPGAAVDVLGTVRLQKSNETITRIVVEGVKVLSVELETDVATATDRNKSSGVKVKRDAVVTIEVTPEQSELVLLAVREGKVDLALRNGNDSRDIDTPGATPALLSVTEQKMVAQDVRRRLNADKKPKRPKRRRPRKPADPGISRYVGSR